MKLTEIHTVITNILLCDCRRRDRYGDTIFIVAINLPCDPKSLSVREFRKIRQRPRSYSQYTDERVAVLLRALAARSGTRRERKNVKFERNFYRHADILTLLPVARLIRVCGREFYDRKPCNADRRFYAKNEAFCLDVCARSSSHSPP